MHRPLDRIDRDILARLQNDARISNKELAAAVHLAPSTCLQRVRHLRDDGILGRAHAQVSPTALGIGLQAMVMVRMQHQSRDKLETLRSALLAREEVLALYEVAGRMDLHVHVAVRDSTHLRYLTLDALSSRPEVRQIETAVIFSYTRSPALPDYLDP